jgi:hypothetical protein
MGQYRVPQNVEAEDKILGPFSFRQFIYLIITGACGVGIFFLVSSPAWPLIFIPLPIGLFCLALALPLRKDQPMETYLLAIIKYLFLPKKRLWRAGSFTPNVDVDSTIINESPNLKDIRGADAASRLSFLAEVVDTAGWSTRGAIMDHANENMNMRAAQEAIREANSTDQFEISNQTARIIDSKLSGGNQTNPVIMRSNNV